MNRSARLSSALHVLVHMAQNPELRQTSETMSHWWSTNPVVVRRTLGQLREAGLVRSIPGPGGGWLLARSPAAISLADVYDALGEMLSGPGFETESTSCRVVLAIESLMAETLRDLESQLRKKYADISLADLVEETGPFQPGAHNSL